MASKINWTKQATDDLYQIHHFLSDGSEKYAEIVCNSIIDSVDRLVRFPRLGRTVPEMGIAAIRELIVYQYRIIYFLRKDGEIELLTIRHSSRPLPTSLFN